MAICPMTFVLVHGGGFDTRCWDELRPLLDAPSLAVDLPGRGSRPRDLSTVSLTEFAAAVAEDVAGDDLSHVTLVGHSMAGLTLPRVAELVPSRLAALVFVSCVVPPQGASLSDVLTDLSPDVAKVAELMADAAVDARGVLHADLATAMFCSDMDSAQTAATLERRVPEAMAVLAEPVDLTGLRHPIPRAYVRLLADASITLDQQDRMIQNIEPADVIDIDSGHMAMISHPEELAAVLNRL